MDNDITILYKGKSGELLRKHIESYILSLESVSDIKIDDKDMIAVEVVARQRAIKKLKEIFKLVEPTEESPLLKDKSQRYGLKD